MARRRRMKRNGGGGSALLVLGVVGGAFFGLYRFGQSLASNYAAQGRLGPGAKAPLGTIPPIKRLALKVYYLGGPIPELPTKVG